MAVRVTSSLTSKIVKSFKEAQLAREHEERIEKATNLCVFGGNSNLRRDKNDYAQSPIIMHLKERCVLGGRIYVAYVPNNCGKTTACYAIMDKPYARRGVAFSPEAVPGVPYFDSVIASLDFDPQNPPDGFMVRLLVELTKGKKHPELTNNFLVLDNFMPHGFNNRDSYFFHNLKSHIKQKNISVLVLTPNREAACRLLSQNELGTIVPLATHLQIRELKKANPRIDPHQPLAFDWERHVSMVWDKDQLKKAIEYDTSESSGALQNAIRQSFDRVYDGLSREEKAAANPMTILQHFDDIRPGGITTPRGVGAPVAEKGGCCGTEINCTIL